jgi:hypothetical protein
VAIKGLISVDMTSSERGKSESGPERTDGGIEPGRQLIGEWAVCGIASAAARFIPVPLLDDAVKHRAIRIAVSRTLRANGRTYSSSLVEPLYAGVDADAASLTRRALKYLRTVPRRVLLFPVRKYVALFGSVRGVPHDVMTVLLLARTVHRSLAAGRLADSDENRLRAEAVQIRAAFDRALDGLDLRMFTGALSDGLSQGKGLTSAAVKYARTTFTRSDKDDVGSADLSPGGAVGEAAERVEEVQRRPEIARLIGEFDTKFDAEMDQKPRRR